MIHEVTASTVVETYDFSALSVFVQFAFSDFRQCFSFEAVQPFRLIAAFLTKTCRPRLSAVLITHFFNIAS